MTTIEAHNAGECKGIERGTRGNGPAAKSGKSHGSVARRWELVVAGKSHAF